jgi:prepilin-type N-terminal cleavage/methylation domain-containing protein/prepilin-type processing-associated H-X9-DG protein
MHTPYRLRQKPGSRRTKGFTLIELLIVITIVIVLAAIAFNISQKVNRSAIKVKDMANLRSLASAAMAAGSDNAGKLPAIHAGTDGRSGPNQAPYYMVGRNTLESYGIHRESCYIPRKGVTGGAPEYTFWTMFGADQQTPIHYNYFANDAPPGVASWFSGTVVPPTRSEYRGTVDYQQMIQNKNKAFPRSFTDDAWYPILWTGLSRDWNGEHLAALMDKGKPLGVNVMYLDGHTEWVDQTKIKVRYTLPNGLKVYW